MVRRVWLAALGAVVVSGCLASAAWASDRAYWANCGSAIRVGNLDGSGSPANLGANFAGESCPSGVAIDPAAGKIYWTNCGSAIRVGNLNGSGSPANLGANYTSENCPWGLAIDPAHNKIYWANDGSGAIRVGNLDGSGSPTDLGANYTGENGVYGVAIDPAAGKIYWTNYNSGGNGHAIRAGNLDGSGSPASLYAGESGPYGLAIDSAAGKIYWANYDSGTIRVGNLNGSGSPANLGATYTSENSPGGVAIDPAAGKIYWATCGSAIRVGNLDGSGSPANLGANYTSESCPWVGALLRAPVGAGGPVVSGGSSVGSTLSCSQGSWSPDLLGAFLWRAPSSFAYQWASGGSDVPGATASSYTASAPGSYTCRVTATNQAGSASQTSAAFTVAVSSAGGGASGPGGGASGPGASPGGGGALPSSAFEVSGHGSSDGSGTIFLTLRLPGPGFLDILGTHAAPASTASLRLSPGSGRIEWGRLDITVTRAGTLTLKLTPNRRGRRLLARHRRRGWALHIRVWATYTPTGGHARSHTIKSIRVLRTGHRHR